MVAELVGAHADCGDEHAEQEEIPQTEHVICVGVGRTACNPSTEARAWKLAQAQGKRAQFGGRSRRNRSTVAYARRQSEVSSTTLPPCGAASSDLG